MAATVPDDAPTQQETDAPHGPGGAVFWITAALGAAIVLFGIRGLLENEPRGAESAIRWFIGGALVLDLVVVPLGAIAGLGARRAVPAWAWPVVRSALLVSVVLIAFAAPLVLEQGGQPSNPTVRPRDYTAGLLASLGATWTVAAAWLALLHRRRRPQP